MLQAILPWATLLLLIVIALFSIWGWMNGKTVMNKVGAKPCSCTKTTVPAPAPNPLPSGSGDVLQDFAQAGNQVQLES